MGFTVTALTATPVQTVSNISHASAMDFASALDVVDWNCLVELRGVGCLATFAPLITPLKQGYNGVVVTPTDTAHVCLAFAKTLDTLRDYATATQWSPSLWVLEPMWQAFAIATAYGVGVALD